MLRVHLLKGRALQWYSRSYLKINTWTDFKNQIKREFLPPNYSEIIKQDLYLRFQGPNESFASFYRDLLAVFEIVEPAMLESEKLFILKSHLNAEFIPIATASRCITVQDLVNVCKDFEVSRSYLTKNRNATLSRPAWTRSDNQQLMPHRPALLQHSTKQPLHRMDDRHHQVNAVAQDIPQQEEHIPTSVQRELDYLEAAFNEEAVHDNVGEINAVRSQVRFPRNTTAGGNSAIASTVNQTRQPLACWQCENPGHTYPSCPNPKTFLFCYTCGKKGCTTRSCENCVTRWRQLTTTERKGHSGNASRESSQ